MKIDTATKVMARLHTDNNGTGLNIYNPYFQAAGLDAVYLLFKNSSPEPLVAGLRNLGISGAVSAGFEHDSSLPGLVDETSEAVKVSGKIGVIANKNGVLKAHYQGGEGLLAAIQEKYDTAGEHVVIVGAGTVAKTLVLALEQSPTPPSNIEIYNRTLEHATQLAAQFKSISSVHPLEELGQASGDILVNASWIGSNAEYTYFTPEIVGKFAAVADVTFGTKHTNLITIAMSNNLATATGWDMFTHQAAIVLRVLLDHQADIPTLRKFVHEGLAATNHGHIAAKTE